MNEACVENCAIKRDCSQFMTKSDLRLIDMPRFPDTAGMTKEEKFTSVTIYLAKVVDHLQGVPDEYLYPVRRQNTHRSPNSRIPPVVQVKDLLPDLTKAISPPETGKERESERVGSSKVAQPAD